MRIVNIIVILNGLVSKIHSYMVDDSPEHPHPQIEAAEEAFKDEVRYYEPDIEDDDLEDAIENGDWDNNSGVNILLTWSDTVS